MGTALVVSGNSEIIKKLTSLLRDEGFTECMTADTASEARKLAESENTDLELVFIYAPLADEVGLNLSMYMTKHTSAGVFIATGRDTAAKAGEKLSQNGVITLLKPVSREAVHQSLLAFRAMQCRIGLIEQKNIRLQAQLEEVRLINRAKLVLMQCLAMSEQQAHRYIEKQAMDLRVTKCYVAKQILGTYEI